MVNLQDFSALFKNIMTIISMNPYEYTALGSTALLLNMYLANLINIV